MSFWPRFNKVWDVHRRGYMTPSSPTEPFEIEIVVEGRLDPRRPGWFESLTLTPQPGGATRITGTLVDHAALFALISRIRDLGLRLVSVNRI